jgi:protein phosphatase
MRPIESSPSPHHEDVSPVQEVSFDSPTIEVAGLSDRGRVQPTNEDCFVTAELRRALVLGASSLPLGESTPWFACPQGKLLAVADGIERGGSNQLASMVAMRVLAGYATAVMPWIIDHDDEDQERLRDELANAMRQCQRQVRHEVDRAGVGSSAVMVTAAYLVWPTVLSVHAGSGRAYLIRRGNLIRLSSDPAESGPPPAGELELDISRATLRRGDQVLLCTDGLVRHVSEREIVQILQRGDTAGTSCRALVDAANERGGEDNVTVTLAQIGES